MLDIYKKVSCAFAIQYTTCTQRKEHRSFEQSSICIGTIQVLHENVGWSRVDVNEVLCSVVCITVLSKCKYEALLSNLLCLLTAWHQGPTPNFQVLSFGIMNLPYIFFSSAHRIRIRLFLLLIQKVKFKYKAPRSVVWVKEGYYYWHDSELRMLSPW